MCPQVCLCDGEHLSGSSVSDGRTFTALPFLRVLGEKTSPGWDPRKDPTRGSPSNPGVVEPHARSGLTWPLLAAPSVCACCHLVGPWDGGTPCGCPAGRGNHNNKYIHMHVCGYIHISIQNKRCPAHHTTTDTSRSLSSSSRSLPPPHPTRIVQHGMTCYATSLWPVRAGCPGSAPSQLLVHPQLLLAGRHEELESPWLNVSTAQQHFKQWCAINIVLLPDLKHSIILAKISFIPAKTRAWGDVVPCV